MNIIIKGVGSHYNNITDTLERQQRYILTTIEYYDNTPHNGCRRFRRPVILHRKRKRTLFKRKFLKFSLDKI